MTGPLCQAHRTHPAEIAHEAEPGVSFQLCKAAARSVKREELTPLEWFNLAGLHTAFAGPLAEAFYDEEGRAAHPVRGGLPAPRLDQVRHDLDRLLDFAFSRRSSAQAAPLVTALREHPPGALLEALGRRVTAYAANAAVPITAAELAAKALRDGAAGFVRALWGEHGRGEIGGYVEALSLSLPAAEARRILMDALQQMDPRQRQENVHLLAHLRSADTLDWLETNVTSPVTETWGRIAACSQLSWPRVCAWLSRGRPLSLVALDGLLEMRGPSPGRGEGMNRNPPRLLEAPALEEARWVLDDYLRRDNVPRVRNTVAAILAHWPEISRS